MHTVGFEKLDNGKLKLWNLEPVGPHNPLHDFRYVNPVDVKMDVRKALASARVNA
jgi:hypothetical protein